MFNIFKKNKKEKVEEVRSYSSNIVNRDEFINQLFTDEDFATMDLDKIRAVSRERARTNTIIGAYARLGENNVVGKGFTLKINKKQNFAFTKKQEEAILEEWNNFCKKENFDSANKLNLREMCAILTRGLLIDGENLIKIIRETPNENNKFGLQFQIFDVNRINSTLNGENVRKGVEFDSRGRIKKIHLRKQVVNQFGLADLQKDGFEDIKNLIYFCNYVSAEQTRGTPYTATALGAIKTLENFDKITLKAAQIGTLLSVYIKKDAQSLKNINDLDVQKSNNISLSSGGIYELNAGESIEGFKGDYPVDLYNKFVDKKINQIARALGLSSTFLANEISGANYAVARFMSNEDREFYQKIQQKIIDNFLNIVFWEFLNALVLYKNYNAKILNLEFSFVASNFEEIDAVKTQAAKNAELKSLRKSFTRLASENNDDFTDVVDEFNADFELMSRKFGIDKKEIINLFFSKSFN